ncbi:MAG TPA: putative lipid II flippase FtsW [Clostridia bacterium]|nr:putative lipid II flippase FtsW [Clostridia bacterium]
MAGTDRAAAAGRPGAARKSASTNVTRLADGGTDHKPARRAGQMDFSLFIAVVVICAFGLVMVFSSSYYYAQDKGLDNGYYYLKNQAMFLALGLALILIISRIDYHKWEKLRVVALAGVLLLMLAVVFFGEERNGATRWLNIFGVSFQPSELAKFVLLLYMAAFMAKRPHLMSSFSRGLLPMLMIIAVMCGILLLQKNMSMMVIVMLTGIVMLYLGGAQVKHLLLLAAIAVPILVVAVMSEDYRVSRVLMFVNPWDSNQEGAYQLRQSLLALGSGGLFGQGLNFSRQKLLFLPYGESDFIFSIIGEELGFMGCLGVIAMYGFVVYRGVRVAMRCKDRFGSLMAAGITAILGIQAAVNIAVATSSVPPTGQTLPFISAGGSSLVIFMCAMGILLNISRNTE